MPAYNFLSENEVELLKEYLVGYVSLPFGSDIPGEIVERLVARARGATYIGKRANRPEPDMILVRGGERINYQIKTEKSSDNRVSALDMRGKASEDIITARIDVISDFKLKDLPNDENELGSMVLRSYVENVIRKYEWHRLAILLRYKQNNEFLYFEEDAIHYNPDDYIWARTSAGKRADKLNIIGYDKDKNGQPILSQKRFKWNVGTTILYVFHQIPSSADYFDIRKKHIDVDAFRRFMEQQKFPSDDDIRAWLLDAIEANEEILHEFLPKIEVRNAVVKVVGEIYPKGSRDALLKAIWETPGVRDIDASEMKLLRKKQAEKRLTQLELLAIDDSR